MDLRKIVTRLVYLEGNAFTCPIVDGRMVDDNNDMLRFLSIRLAG